MSHVLSQIPLTSHYWKSINLKIILRRRALSITLMGAGYFISTTLYVTAAPLMRYGWGRSNFSMMHYSDTQYHWSLMYACVWPIPFMVITYLYRRYIMVKIHVDPLYMLNELWDTMGGTIEFSSISVLCSTVMMLVFLKNSQVIWYIFPTNGIDS